MLLVMAGLTFVGWYKGYAVPWAVGTLVGGFSLLGVLRVLGFAEYGVGMFFAGAWTVLWGFWMFKGGGLTLARDRSSRKPRSEQENGS